MFADDELAHIAELIDELVEELGEDTWVEADLREFLLFHAEAMTEAIRDIDLRGPAAVEEAFDQAVGAAQRRRDLTVRIESDNSAWQKFGNVIVAVAALLQITTSSLALPGQIRQEIEGPAPATPPVVRVVIENPRPPLSDHASAAGQDGGGQR